LTVPSGLQLPGLAARRLPSSLAAFDFLPGRGHFAPELGQEGIVCANTGYSGWPDIEARFSIRDDLPLFLIWRFFEDQQDEATDCTMGSPFHQAVVFELCRPRHRPRRRASPCNRRWEARPSPVKEEMAVTPADAGSVGLPFD
jgi:hypothetical protein